MGYRQMSQLSMFDYINGITIGSIAAELATGELATFDSAITALIIYGLVAFLLSVLCNKSISFRRMVEGKSALLYNNGELYYKNLKKAKMDVNELLIQCRVNGYFDLNNIQTILLESNGKISILPKVTERPVTPKDLGLTPEQDYLVANVIIDGKLMLQNLKHTGKDEKWLTSQLSSQGYHDVSEIFLATCDLNNKLTIYRKINQFVQINIIE